MAETRFSPHRLCPNCGAVLDAGAERCFLCRVQLGPPAQPATPPEQFTVPDLQQVNPALALLMLIVLGLLALGLMGSVLASPHSVPQSFPLGFLILFVLAPVPFLVRSWHNTRDPRTDQSVPVYSPRS